MVQSSKLPCDDHIIVSVVEDGHPVILTVFDEMLDECYDAAGYCIAHSCNDSDNKPPNRSCGDISPHGTTAMSWTLQKPTKPGWYWFREPGLNMDKPMPAWVIAIHRQVSEIGFAPFVDVR